MDKPNVSRRHLLSTATVAAASIGLSQLASAAPTRAADDARPRLPLKILYRDKLNEDSIAQIKGVSPQIEVIAAKDDWRSALPTADVIFAGIGHEDYQAAKKLRWVQYPS